MGVFAKTAVAALRSAGRAMLSISASPFAGALVPRQPRAQPVTINESAMNEGKNEVLAASHMRPKRAAP